MEFGMWEPSGAREARKKPQSLTAPTVGEWLEQWLGFRARDLKPASHQQYEVVIRRRILDESGLAGKLRSIRLGVLSRRDIVVWRTVLIRRHGHIRDVDNAYARLKTALTAAVEAEWDGFRRSARSWGSVTSRPSLRCICAPQRRVGVRCWTG